MTSFNEQVFVDSIPDTETLAYHPLETRYRTGQLIFSTIFSIFLFGLFLFYLLFQPFEVPYPIVYIVAALLIVRAIWSVVRIVFGFKHKTYAVREKDIIYKSGWLWRSITTAPFNRVQHLSISQGPIERKLNLSRLKIFTAGGSSSDLTIPGLSPETAEKIKAFIVDKTGMDEEE